MRLTSSELDELCVNLGVVVARFALISYIYRKRGLGTNPGAIRAFTIEVKSVANVNLMFYASNLK